MSMTENDAIWTLSRMVASDQTPLLDDEELHRLVTVVAPRGDGTYDLRRAAAEGWRWKAAKVAGAFNLSIDGGAINRGDLLAHCREMVKLYSRQGPRSVALVNGEAAARYRQADAWRYGWTGSR